MKTLSISLAVADVFSADGLVSKWKLTGILEPKTTHFGMTGTTTANRFSRYSWRIRPGGYTYGPFPTYHTIFKRSMENCRTYMFVARITPAFAGTRFRYQRWCYGGNGRERNFSVRWRALVTQMYAVYRGRELLQE